MHSMKMGDHLALSRWVLHCSVTAEKCSLLAFIFRETSFFSFFSKLNYTGHKQEAVEAKLRGHFILNAVNDYS